MLSQRKKRILETGFEKLGLQPSSTKDRMQFYKELFPLVSYKIEALFKQGCSMKFPEVLPVIAESYMNTYDEMSITTGSHVYKVEFKNFIEEFIDFDFTDDVGHSNHDLWFYHKDFDIVKLVRSNRANKDSNNFIHEKFLVSRTKLLVHALRNVPEEIILETPVTLANCDCRTSIRVTEKDPRIYIIGKSIVRGKKGYASIIMETDSVVFKGHPSLAAPTVVIEKDTMQPCIGTSTTTGLSNNRWSKTDVQEFSIVLSDEAEVICKSDENFSLGTYGDITNYIPPVALGEECCLNAPEMKGKRVIIDYAIAPAGSTKITEPMRYELLKDDMTIADFYSDEDKEIVKGLREHGVKVPEDYLVNSNKLAKAFKYRFLANKASFDLLFNPETSTEHAAAATCMKIPEAYSKVEFMFEQKKTDYFIGKYGKQEDKLSVINSLIKAGFDCLMTNIYGEVQRIYLEELLWCMIPSYSFRGNWRQEAIKVVSDYLTVCTEFAKEVNTEEFLKDYYFKED